MRLRMVTWLSRLELHYCNTKQFGSTVYIPESDSNNQHTCASDLIVSVFSASCLPSPHPRFHLANHASSREGSGFGHCSIIEIGACSKLSQVIMFIIALLNYKSIHHKPRLFVTQRYVINEAYAAPSSKDFSLLYLLDGQVRKVCSRVLLHAPVAILGVGVHRALRQHLAPVRPVASRPLANRVAHQTGCAVP